MRKSIEAIQENRVVMQTKVPNLRDKYEKHIVLTVVDQDKNFQSLLEYIKQLSDYGHGFTISVDPDDKEYHKDFYIDGDGTDHISNITIDSYEG